MSHQKNKKAIALKYDQRQDFAPKVTSKGSGLTADEIIKQAAEYDVPIQEDTNLAELLSELNINEKIPQELYQAVAEVFAFIYHLDEKQTHNQNK